jgi:hypothetical protein
MSDMRFISPRLLLLGLVAFGLTAAMIASAAAQPFTETAGGSVIGRANALAARIHAFHRWTGSTTPPASYCSTMRAGDAVMVELAARKPGGSLPPDRIGAGAATGGRSAGRRTRRRRGDQ